MRWRLALVALVALQGWRAVVERAVEIAVGEARRGEDNTQW